MIDIYAVRINRLELEMFEKLLAFVPEERRTAINKFLKYEDALRALMSSLLVKNVISSRLKIKTGDISLGRNEFGKPHLLGRDGLFFNVSHSGAWVICAAGSSPVGADIEFTAPIDPLFVEHFFSQEEFEAIVKQDPKKRTGYFYDLWTLKESYIKAVGRGLFIPLDSFTVEIGDSGRIRFSSLVDSSKYYFSRYDFDSNYKIALCSTDPAHNEKIIIKDQDEICDSIFHGFAWN